MKEFKFEYDLLFKLILIGDSGVGKTSLTKRFCLDEYRENYISTIGVDFNFTTINYKDKIVKLQIWDTAGQERFKCITTSYYRGVHGVLIVFDTTDYETFENIKVWLAEINRYVVNTVPIIIIGSKCDLFNKRKVDSKEAKDYAFSIGADYIEISSKENINVYKTFEEMTKKIINTSPVFNNSLNSASINMTPIVIERRNKDNEPYYKKLLDYC